MDYGYCPRCGTRRPDAFRWCRKCGLDFQNPPKSETHASAPPAHTSVAPGENRISIDVRPVGDRRDLARWTRDVFTVRCLGTLGGMVGMFLGFFVMVALGGAVSAGPFSLVLGLIGLPLGFFLGVRLTLGLLTK